MLAADANINDSATGAPRSPLGSLAVSCGIDSSGDCTVVGELTAAISDSTPLAAPVFFHDGPAFVDAPTFFHDESGPTFFGAPTFFRDEVAPTFFGASLFDR